MQKHKPSDRKAADRSEYVEVDLDDIRLANELANEFWATAWTNCRGPPRLAQLLLKKWWKPGEGGDTLKRKKEHETDANQDAGRALHAGKSGSLPAGANARVHRYLQELIELEYVLMEPAATALHRYRLAYDGQGKDGGKFLLGLKPGRTT